MELSKAQSTAFEKARSRGSGDQGIVLTDGTVRALVTLVARDLALPEVEGIDPLDDQEFYDIPVDKVTTGGDALALSAYCSLLQKGLQEDWVDTDTYFLSLVALHRARLKFANILRLQATPTLEQVGPRGLLQYGNLSTEALGSLLIVRKWFYDIDNRSAQETGYLFEPVIAGAVGGVPVSARSSPVRRKGTGKGRQVDCLLGKKAYEIKMRVTNAASGQGRWQEELAFPADCKASNFKPVLVVLDSTNDPKLSQLSNEFTSNGGEAYIGKAAWEHLKLEAGDTMSKFIEKYIRAPLHDLLKRTPPEKDLPRVSLLLRPDSAHISVGETEMHVHRSGSVPATSASMPDDVDAALPGLDFRI